MKKNKMSYNRKKYHQSYHNYNNHYYSYNNNYDYNNSYSQYYTNNDYHNNSAYSNRANIKSTEDKIQEELLKKEEQKMKIVSEINAKINTEIRYLITDRIRSLFNFPKKPVFEKFGEVAKKIRSLIKIREFTVEMIINIIGNTLKETRNSLEILNKIMFYAEIFKNLQYFSSNSIQQFINRSFSPSNFCILNQEYLKNILHYKILERPNSLEEYVIKMKDFRRSIDLEKNEYYHYLPLNCSDNNNLCIKLNSLIQDNLSILVNSDQDLNSLGQEPLNQSDRELNLRWNCIFSHNIIETNYHPMNYKTSLCFNQKLCDKKQHCYMAHSEDELILLFNQEQYTSIINDLNHLTDPNNNVQGILYKHFINSSLNDTVSDDILYIKTIPCSNKLLCKDFKACYNYHNSLEKRRDPTKYINYDNTICEYVFINKKWEDPSKCPKGDKCDKFHTKNELMYDSRNYRKLFECEAEKSYKFCPYIKFCYYKHAEDLQIQQMYMSENDKHLLNDLLDSLQKKKENFERIKEISKKFYSCLYCLEIIKEYEVFLKCEHYYCYPCFEKLVKENNSICIICKFKFRENEKDLYYIGKLCSKERINEMKIQNLTENISNTLNDENIQELMERDYNENIDEINQDLQNLFKKSNK